MLALTVAGQLGPHTQVLGWGTVGSPPLAQPWDSELCLPFPNLSAQRVCFVLFLLFFAVGYRVWRVQERAGPEILLLGQRASLAKVTRDLQWWGPLLRLQLLTKGHSPTSWKPFLSSASTTQLSWHSSDLRGYSFSLTSLCERVLGFSPWTWSLTS